MSGSQDVGDVAGRRAIPLAERRCTRCGRGVADGVAFGRRRAGAPNSYRAVCTACETARVKAARKEHGWSYGKRPPTPAASPRDLTPRQREVLALLAAGLSDQQIARRLGCARQTVAHMVTAIYAQMPPGEGDNFRVRAARWQWEEAP